MEYSVTLSNAANLFLTSEADKKGTTVSLLAAEIIEQSIPQDNDRDRAKAILERWKTEDLNLTEEQLEKHQSVLRAIDRDRLSDRKLFEQVLSET